MGSHTRGATAHRQSTWEEAVPGSPTSAMPSSTPIARMIRAKYGGMRNLLADISSECCNMTRRHLSMGRQAVHKWQQTLCAGTASQQGLGRAGSRVVKGDLRQVSRQLLEVDVLGTAALQGLVEHLQRQRQSSVSSSLGN